jgi:hypothetical protein
LPLRRVLWRELHRGLPEQRVLLHDPAPPTQLELVPHS